MTNYPTPTYLSELNTHPRDLLITFEEGPHIYTINGERGTYTSCTTFVHSHFSDFDADKIIDTIITQINKSKTYILEHKTIINNQ